MFLKYKLFLYRTPLYNLCMENKSPWRKKLNDLGFSEAEALVYIFLVNNGASSIQTVTDAVALPRSTVNLSIETLVKRGIVSFFTRGKRKIMYRDR